ncbi:MAG: HEPN domain-containing protein [Fimbriimonadales bacterium]|nr:HEPN domain-containing protein [Fimbriimonadales bacterium]
MIRGDDWMAQARRDLESAQWAIQGGYYEWACFMCQQAAEKALKAVYAERGAETWGRSVRHLLRGLQREIDAAEYRALSQCARDLDSFYIPTRYPDSENGGAPYENYQKADAEAALDCAQRILRLCDDLLAR